MEARLKGFGAAWARITSHSWVLETVERGYSLEFASPSSNWNRIRSVMNPFSKPLLEELKALQAKEAVEPVPVHQRGQGVYTHAFLRPKRTGGVKSTYLVSIVDLIYTFFLVQKLRIHRNI